MKNLSLPGLLAAVLLVAGFMVPANLMRPAPVEAGICKWETIITPLVVPTRNDIVRCSELHDMATGNDGKTIIVTANRNNNTRFYYSNNGGRSFSGSKWNALNRAPQWPAGAKVYSVAIAPDNPKFYAVTTDVAGAIGGGPREVWVTQDTGTNWDLTNLNLPPGETIRCIDISVDYGGKRDIAVGTTTGAGGGRLFVVQSTGFGSWVAQAQPTASPRDYFALKFSPTYPSDAAIAAVYATVDSTFYNIGRHDINLNVTPSWVYADPGIEVKDPTWLPASSPGYGVLNKADLELPSDFSGQATSLSRAYISLDAFTGAPKAGTDHDGIFRIDDTVVYTLMDTSNVTQKSIYSIVYFGTYASGKLLAGERMGFPCTASVPTWFTDSPTTCPIPCWYPALKPTTGAAGQATCTVGAQDGVGAAVVTWNSDGKLGMVITGSQAINTGAGWFNSWLGVSVCDDESAFAISRNNGETWNQLALIDTTITRLTDVAPTPDCKTVYIASVNEGAGCDEFDSVWRSSSNVDVVSPLPALPIGEYWERVLTRVTADNCTNVQTDVSLLRLVPFCADPTGQIVAWGVFDPGKTFTTGVAMWSPDYGDYWAIVSPRYPIQDFCFESNTVMYFLNPDGLVQKMPYTGTAWGTSLASVDTLLMGAHTIAAYPEGKVLVGASTDAHSMLYATSFTSNFNTDTPSFSVMSLAGKTDAMGNVHTAFDPNFKDNSTIFIADDDDGVGAGEGGSVYRNTPAAQIPWADVNMMNPSNNGAIGCDAPHEVGQYGLILSFTGEALYSAHDYNCGVCRTIDDGTGKYGPLSGMPKPGIAWDCLQTFVNPPTTGNPCFTLEPSSLKACGCCTLDTNTTLYAIDNASYSVTNRTGMVWTFTDCMAKRGPKLITEDKALIGCDPVSGRAQEVNFCWEQLCVASEYDIEVAKSADFSIRIIDWTTEDGCGGLEPVDVTKPCAYFPAGGGASYNAESDTGAAGSAIAFYGNLECGHTYYWRVKVRECATGQWIRSPWSEARSFTVKAGLPVTTPYYGPQLLAPNNGCLGCPVGSVSFSWSPFKETTKYEFILASDAALTQVLRKVTVPTPAYEYYDTLEYGTNYFWQVKALEPAPSDPSSTFSFQTEAQPSELAGPAPTPPTPFWVWVVIAIGAILVIVTLVLIFKTRRV